MLLVTSLRIALTLNPEERSGSRDRAEPRTRSSLRLVGTSFDRRQELGRFLRDGLPLALERCWSFKLDLARRRRSQGSPEARRLESTIADGGEAWLRSTRGPRSLRKASASTEQVIPLPRSTRCPIGFESAACQRKMSDGAPGTNTRTTRSLDEPETMHARSAPSRLRP